MKACSLILAALLVSTPALAQPDPSVVVAAERAFAADGLAHGIKRSFLAHSAPDAILFAPDPIKAHDLYGPRPDKPHPPLVWWPLWAGIARSGDLGFTTGPSTFDGKENGWYFTVWARQEGGGWKWIYDGGSPSAHGAAPPQGSAPTYLTPATGPQASAAAAMSAVQAAETTLAKAAASNSAGAYLAILAPDARVTGSPAVPATTPAAVKTELAARPAAIAFSPLGGRASSGGDLVWTYGDARWTDGRKDRRGHYVRMWQSRADGWRLVFDQILPVAEPAS
ncbi:MAG: DUF4440 domain-containing protein [Phenylobacterium sp.]|uniref:nuclear transport factor 2 family protein n=1 Tax=Phenylobacterium sp. TaxID=1871053 RepID=UPI0025E9D22C|nr:nuclear transport factor 2 family protein [Phenylobacterium sp.]MBA4013064.1 DUF4440 domain-containing protein [Phenylobacterium sp.]